MIAGRQTRNESGREERRGEERKGVQLEEPASLSILWAKTCGHFVSCFSLAPRFLLSCPCRCAVGRTAPAEACERFAWTQVYNFAAVPTLSLPLSLHLPLLTLSLKQYQKLITFCCVAVAATQIRSKRRTNSCEMDPRMRLHLELQFEQSLRIEAGCGWATCSVVAEGRCLGALLVLM